MADQGYVKSEIENGVATIEFFHPKSNSLPSSLLKELAESIKAAGANDQVKVILLKSGGDRAFCAGASFDELLAVKDAESGKSFFSGFANVILAIKNAPKFVVAQIQGKTVGGGVGIACAADYVIASSEASVKLSELSIGIGPFVIGPAVERKIGKAAFGNMSIAAKEWKTADWALEAGMFSKVVSPSDLNNITVGHVLELQAYSPQAMKEIKSMLWEGTDNWVEVMEQRAIQSGTLVLSDFTRTKLSEFKNK